MQMKKYLILLVLAVVCCSTVQAQRYYIPRYKKQKEAREYEHFHADRKFTVTLGASFDMNLGMQNYINLDNDAAAVRYDQEPKLPAVTTTLGVSYLVSPHFVAGLEAGYSFSNENHIIPAYGTFKWYYGKEKHPHRVRWFNYLNVGPQFYTGSKYNVLYSSGFRYFINNASSPWAEIGNGYVRQSRLMVTGANMAYYSHLFSDYFNAVAVLNSSRGTVPS